MKTLFPVDFLINNPSVLLSPEKTRSYLCDVFYGEKLRVNLLMYAYNIGIVQERRRESSFDEFARNGYVKKLISEHGVSRENALWAVEEWCAVLSDELVLKINEAEIRLAELRRIEAQSAVAQTEQETVAVESEQDVPEGQHENSAAETEDDTSGEPTFEPTLAFRHERENFYVNPAVPRGGDIYIPCGFGKGSGGFFIRGIKKKLRCTHPDANVYALVYNYLTRNSLMDSKKDLPTVLKEHNDPCEPGYESVFRLAILLLQMVRHNCFEGEMKIDLGSDDGLLGYALMVINEYAALFSRLIGVEMVKMDVKNDKNGVKVSVFGHNGIHIVENETVVSNAREVWLGKKINYHLSEKNKPDLEYILREISPFRSFKPGQFDSLCEMLSNRDHSVCIMPTGSGKSLIFYFAALLQPLPVFVVSPTDILIEDQIRNLRERHRIDNVAHLLFNEDNDFSNWELGNCINYLTPMTLQNRNLLTMFRYYNSGTKLINMHEERIAPGALISYIVLDEIHCISNWGHDFRPEYLMLSKYLNKFFDNITLWGFTATANYSIVGDIQKQLDIPEENFFSPLSFEKYNISFDFRAQNGENDMLDTVCEAIGTFLKNNERTIIFTNGDETSRKVAERIGPEADIFDKNNPKGYYHFANQKSRVLVASEDLGVGINLPRVNNVIHFGLPLSKDEYVQEIGRAGRDNEKVKSLVLYLESGNKEFSSVLSPLYDKISDAQTLNGNLHRKFESYQSGGQVSYYEPSPDETIEDTKKLLYMLYVTGYVNDWYVHSQTDGVKNILVDICSTNAALYRSDPKLMLGRMKQKLSDYLADMGENREEIHKIMMASTPCEILDIYSSWYFDKYLYQHKERFNDLYEFIVRNVGKSTPVISKEIRDYFVLPFAQIRADEQFFSEASFDDILQRIETGVEEDLVSNLERINSNKYSPKLEFSIIICTLMQYDSWLESRANRLLPQLSKAEKGVFLSAVAYAYSSCSPETRLALINYLQDNQAQFDMDILEICGVIYNTAPKDVIYYGILSKYLNKAFDKLRRKANV